MSEIRGVKRDPGTLDKLLAERDPKVLIRGASVITMDSDHADLPRGDVLVDGAKIEAVGPDLSEAASDGQAIVVDATDSVLLPGFVDAHRHCWQTQFRRLLPNCVLADYIELLHSRLAPVYEPEDMYTGVYLAALGAIDAGVTCVLDFAHNVRGPDYSDEAIRAWKDSGARGVFASCVPLFGEWDAGWKTDLARLREQHFSSDDSLVTLRMGLATKVFPLLEGEICLTPEKILEARELGIGVTVDAVFGANSTEHVVDMGRSGTLGDDVTWIHCTNLGDEAWRVIRDTGGHVALAVTSDEQLGCEGGVPPVQKALDLGIQPSLSVDVECCLTTDMFTQMQVMLNTQRMMAASEELAGDTNPSTPMSVREVLESATVAGAKANGVWDRCGSITPGKQADLLLIDAGAINSMPLNNAVATAVLGADPRNIDTVMVGGVPRKWAGDLVSVDVEGVAKKTIASRDRLLDRIGYELDVSA